VGIHPSKHFVTQNRTNVQRRTGWFLIWRAYRFRHIFGLMGRLDVFQEFKPGSLLATVVSVTGSGYRRPGARMIFRADGTRRGSVSGGCLERELIRHGSALAQNGPVTVLYDTRSEEFLDPGKFGTGCEGVVAILLQRFEDVGFLDDLTTCLEDAVLAQIWDGPAAQIGSAILWREGACVEHGLKMFGGLKECVDAVLLSGESVNLNVLDRGWKIFVEYLEPRPEILVIGAGPDTRVLSSLAKMMGFTVRVAWHDPLRFSEFPNILCETIEGGSLEAIRVSRNTAIVLMTHDLRLDGRLSQDALQSPAWYVGLMGPKMRTAKVVGKWHEDGWLPGKELTRLHTPVGLDLGGDSPEEVALSVLAEIVALKNKRSGGHLKDRARGIHEPIRELTIQSL